MFPEGMLKKKKAPKLLHKAKPHRDSQQQK
jgi:hypothetical protein